MIKLLFLGALTIEHTFTGSSRRDNSDSSSSKRSRDHADPSSLEPSSQSKSAWNMKAEDIYEFWKRRDNREPKSMNNRAKLQCVDEKVGPHVRKIAVHTRSKDELLAWANNPNLRNIVVTFFALAS